VEPGRPAQNLDESATQPFTSGHCFELAAMQRDVAPVAPVIDEGPLLLTTKAEVDPSSMVVKAATVRVIFMVMCLAWFYLECEEMLCL
jgi:hypothetical protein